MIESDVGHRTSDVRFEKGDFIASGAFRDVYIHAADPGLVVKEQKDLRQEHNRREHRIWTERKELHQWLVPVLKISHCGRWLVAPRGEPIGSGEVPQTSPKVLTDKGRKNWVRLNGKVLLCDYGQPKTFKKIYGIKP